MEPREKELKGEIEGQTGGQRERSREGNVGREGKIREYGQRWKKRKATGQDDQLRLWILKR